MKKPTIGKTAAGKTLPLDVDSLVESRLVAAAASGSGKSWLLRRVLEQTHGQIQHIVIDPEDEFASLREKYDYVLAAPSGGDCPADVKSAALLARRLLELRVSAVVGIYELKAHQRIAFVRNFLDALVNAPRKLWHPALVVLDEAHVFCPQKGSADSKGAVIDLMSRGRKRGLCALLATQRFSKLDKDAVAEARNKIIGCCGLRADRDRAADELGITDATEKRALQSLDPGDFYCYGPALSRTPVKVKVGAVKTTHPKAGQRAATPPAPLAKVKAVLSKLADLPKAAEEEARTAAELRAQVKGLKRDLRAAQKGAVDPAALERAREQGRAEGRREVGDALRQAEHCQKRAEAELGKAAAAVERATAAIAGAVLAKVDTAPPRPRGVARSGPSARKAGPSRFKPATPMDLPVSRQRILDALALLESVGINRADRVQLAAFSKQKPTSGGYKNNLGALRSAGLIDYPEPRMVELTDEGRAAASAPESPPTTDELHAMVQGMLPASRWRILSALIDSYPTDMNRDELAHASDQRPTSGGYKNNLGALRSLGFIDYPKRGHVVALPVLFLEAS